jgi:hypothetical protein
MKLKEAVEKHMVNHLLQMCKNELNLNELPEIEFLDQPFLEAGGKKSFGEFDGQKIRVVVQNRHFMDIARTLSHELTHWKQRLANMDMNGEDGSETENQANAIAGIILRKFGQRYPEYFVNSLP